MRELLFLFLTIVFVTLGCKNKQTTEYTILGDYTPYDGCIERLAGKVQKVTEKYYLAIPDGKTFKKGARLTRKIIDSLKITQAYEAVFDNEGHLIGCTNIDENNKPFAKWEFTKENNILNQAKFIFNDTLRIYQKLKYNNEGYIIEAVSYRAGNDTLMNTTTVKISPDKDTIDYHVLDYKGAPINRILNLYNDKGQFLSYGSYNKDGSFHAGNSVTYKEKGKMNH